MAPWFGRGRAQHKALSSLADAGGPLVRYAEQGLPDPATPVMAVRTPSGMSTSTFLRL